jgi:hypothetical protein
MLALGPGAIAFVAAMVVLIPACPGDPALYSLGALTAMSAALTLVLYMARRWSAKPPEIRPTDRTQSREFAERYLDLEV